MNLKTSTLLFLILFFSFESFSQISYTDIKPDASADVLTDTSDSLVTIDFNADGTEDYNFRWDYYDSEGWFIHTTYALISTNLMAVSGTTSFGPLVNPLKVNTTIGSSLTFTNHRPEPFLGNHENANFRGLGDRYIGCKFRIGINTHYGWIRVNLDTNLKLVVKDYAYEKKPNTTINAGDTGATASVNDFDFDSNFSCFPVPAKNSLTIENKKSVRIVQVSITNLTGQLLLSKKSIDNNSSIIIDISQLKTGIYFLNIENEKNVFSKKIIIE